MPKYRSAVRKRADRLAAATPYRRLDSTTTTATQTPPVAAPPPRKPKITIKKAKVLNIDLDRKQAAVFGFFNDVPELHHFKITPAATPSNDQLVDALIHNVKKMGHRYNNSNNYLHRLIRFFTFTVPNYFTTALLLLLFNNKVQETVAWYLAILVLALSSFFTNHFGPLISLACIFANSSYYNFRRCNSILTTSYIVILVFMALFASVHSTNPTSTIEGQYILRTHYSNIPFNADSVYVGSSYAQCDQRQRLKDLKEIQRLFNVNCDRHDFNITDKDNFPQDLRKLISHMDDKVIIFSGRMNKREALNACHQLSATLPIPQTDADMRTLSTYMEQVGFNEVWSGFIVDADSNEILLDGSGKIVNYTFLQSRNVMNPDNKLEPLDIVHLLNLNMQQSHTSRAGLFFTFKLHAGILRLNFNYHHNHGDKIYQHKHVGISYRVNTICYRNPTPPFVNKFAPALKATCRSTSYNMDRVIRKKEAQTENLYAHNLPNQFQNSLLPFYPVSKFHENDKRETRPKRSAASLIHVLNHHWSNFTAPTGKSLKQICDSFEQSNSNTDPNTPFIDTDIPISTTQSRVERALPAALVPLALFFIELPAAISFFIHTSNFLNYLFTPISELRQTSIPETIPDFDLQIAELESKIESATNYSTLLYNDIILQKLFDNTVDLLDQTNTITYSSLFAGKYVPTENFLTSERIAKISKVLRNSYDVHIYNDFSYYRTQFFTNGERLFQATALPIQDPASSFTLLEIIPVPYYDETANANFINTLEHRFYAVNSFTQQFVPLNSQEFMSCLQDPPTCVSSLPIQTIWNSPTCGLNTYFKIKEPKNCPKSEHSSKPFFLTIDSKIFYSTSTNITVVQRCSDNSYDNSERGLSLPLSGIGSLELSPFCTLHFNSTSIKPTNTINTPKHKHKPSYKNTQLRNYKYTPSFDLSKFIPQHFLNKLRFYGALSGIALAALILLVCLFCCCCKCKRFRSFCCAPCTALINRCCNRYSNVPTFDPETASTNSISPPPLPMPQLFHRETPLTLPTLPNLQQFHKSSLSEPRQASHDQCLAQLEELELPNITSKNANPTPPLSNKSVRSNTTSVPLEISSPIIPPIIEPTSSNAQIIIQNSEVLIEPIEKPKEQSTFKQTSPVPSNTDNAVTDNETPATTTLP